MFQVARSVELVSYIIFLVAGSIIGVVAGALLSRILKVPLGETAKDALIGALGFLLGWFLVVTIRYQHPFVVATILAIFLPVYHQVHRRRHLNSQQK